MSFAVVNHRRAFTSSPSHLYRYVWLYALIIDIVYTLLYTVSIARIIHGWPAYTISTANTDGGPRDGYHGTKVPPTMLNLFFDVVKLSEGWSRLVEEDSSCRSKSIGRRLYTVCIRWWRLRAAFACVIYYFIISCRTPLGWLGVGGEVRELYIFIRTAGFTLLFVVIALNTRFCLAVITLAHAKLHYTWTNVRWGWTQRVGGNPSPKKTNHSFCVHDDVIE